MSRDASTKRATTLKGVSIRNSNARGEARGLLSSGEVASAIVRCGECQARLFDLVSYREYEVSWQVEKPCRRCNLMNDRVITVSRGYPKGDNGRWICAGERCGGFLAEVDAIRGRLTVKCRCGTTVRVTAEAVIDAVRAHPAQVPFPRPDDFESDLDDVPF